jgi:glycerophosphoryl diester phosphodiesterase
MRRKICLSQPGNGTSRQARNRRGLTSGGMRATGSIEDMTQAATERASLRTRLLGLPSGPEPAPRVQERGRVWVIGHRGAMGYCPENTLSSFERALALGADWIELDVHMTRDGALAVIHDETLDRTTNGHGPVQATSAAELTQLDAGGGERVPFLPEVLDWARTRGTVVDVEIKNAPVYYAGIESAVVSAVQDSQMTDQVIVISFDHRAVRRVHELDSRIVTGVLYGARPVDGGVSLARAANADALLPHYAYVTKEDVQLAHAAGLAVAPWATSEPEQLRKLIDAGVDAIATNHPDILRKILGARS